MYVYTPFLFHGWSVTVNEVLGSVHGIVGQKGKEGRYQSGRTREETRKSKGILRRHRRTGRRGVVALRRWRGKRRRTRNE